MCAEARFFASKRTAEFIPLGDVALFLGGINSALQKNPATDPRADNRI